MGLPALRHEPPQRAQRPRLRVVQPQARPGGRPKKRASHAGAYQAFIFFSAIIIVVAVLGLGRVWLSVQAAQASIESAQLQRAIVQERYSGDMLEVQQSALATPSRIQAIAGRTMGMAPATSYMYLKLDTSSGGAQPVAAGAQQTKTKVGGVLKQVMNVAAGEAQTLLVGDLGLSSTK